MKPNMFIIYVSDAPDSARYYSKLFELEPDFETPRFVSFHLGADVHFALWSGHESGAVDGRTSELCLTLDDRDEIDELFARWAAQGLTVVQEPHDDVFGRTFVVADPDGNLIRVAPVD